MPTIQDVARDAGVSTATVSRVFSAPDLVLEGTRQKVMEAVARLGYEPNFAAKSLRTLRTEKILVTVPDISNPFFSRVIRGVEEAAHAAVFEGLTPIGGSGGLIAIDRQGNLCLPFNSEGMYRGHARVGEMPHTAIYR